MRKKPHVETESKLFDLFCQVNDSRRSDVAIGNLRHLKTKKPKNARKANKKIAIRHK